MSVQLPRYLYGAPAKRLVESAVQGPVDLPPEGSQKDPRGGPPVPMIELTAEGTKKFLGLTNMYGKRNPCPSLSMPRLSSGVDCSRGPTISDKGYVANRSTEPRLDFPRSFMGPLW